MPDPSSPTNLAQGMPIPYITAAWSGMSYDDIVAGLHAGSILPPPGAAAGWVPQPGTVGVAYSPAAAQAQVGQAAETAQIPNPSERDDVARWFGTLDPSLSTAGFDALWQRAGTNDAQRAERLTGFLARTLLGAPEAAGDAQADATAGKVGAALDAFLADPAHRAHVVDLATMNGADMAAQAASDVGMRYALAHMDSMALTGNRSLFAASNADGALDRFDRDTGESLISDAWLEDRGKFLAWKLAGEQGNEPAVAGSEDWTFVDRAASDANGAPLTLELRTGTADAGKNQVVFGTADGDVMKGVRGSDRMYGGAGEDVLLGGAGGDHLEGGDGADVVMGGAGNDELLGNQGDDELDGGAGADTLQAGSGDDTLTGGRGSDRLEGGLGSDTYSIAAGDGADTIVDSDGLGAIELDGEVIGGSMSRNDSGTWASADGRLEFTFDGDAVEGGVLTMRAFAAGADHSGTPDNVVRVKDWKNGELGITLSGGADPALLGTGETTSTAGNDTMSEASAKAPAAVYSDLAGEGAVAVGNGGAPADGAAAPAEPASIGADEAEPGAVASPVESVDGMDVPSAGAEVLFSPPGELGAVTNANGSDPFDFNAAFDSLLDFGTTAAKGLDPMSLQRGVDAFAGVLAPPDVAMASFADAQAPVVGLTAMDIADAMASDVSADDLHTEAATAVTAALGDVRSFDAAMMPPGVPSTMHQLSAHK